MRWRYVELLQELISGNFGLLLADCPRAAAGSDDVTLAGGLHRAVWKQLIVPITDEPIRCFPIPAFINFGVLDSLFQLNASRQPEEGTFTRCNHSSTSISI